MNSSVELPQKTARKPITGFPPSGFTRGGNDINGRDDILMGIPTRISGLYALADTMHRPDLTPFDLAREFVRGGAPIIQLRMKGKKREEIRQQAERIMTLKIQAAFTFIVNDDPVIAREVGADGAHVGQGDMKVTEARRIVGADRLVGVSTHSLEEAIAAEKNGADYIACGAIFPSVSKPRDHIVIGLEGLKEIAAAVKIPIVAIGGINRDNFREVLETGASAIAMISALSKSPDIAAETRFFCREMIPP